MSRTLLYEQSMPQHALAAVQQMTDWWAYFVESISILDLQLQKTITVSNWSIKWRLTFESPLCVQWRIIWWNHI
jgi:hypothetical protein